MNNHKIKALTSLLIAITLLFFCGCESTKSSTAQIYALDTVIDLTAYGENAEAGLDAAKEEIYRLEKLLSVTKEESDIYRLNNSKGESVNVDFETYSLLEKALILGRLSEDNFDITIYNVLKLWGFTQDEHTVPNDASLSEALLTVGRENVLLNSDYTVSLKNNTQVDLGGIAKGYIGDRAAEAMKNAGVTSGLISIGGNVRVIGEKPSDKNFTVGIKYPEGNSYFGTIKATEKNIITSGAYQRNFTQDDVTYHHIIDPDTGYPSCSDAISVTIIGEDGTMCDAFSTAIFIGGTDYAEALRSAIGGFEYVILTENNTVYVSEGLENEFSLSEEYKHLNVEII